MDEILLEEVNKKPNAVLTSLVNKVRLSVYTNQPTIQLYTGFYLNAQFTPYQGLCLEAQNYVDAVNHKHFPSDLLEPNQQYQRHIVFAFVAIH